MDNLSIVSATPARWADLEALFGPNGAYSGCWCSFLRQSSKDFERNCPNGGPANRQLLADIVQRGDEPGLLAYRDNVPVGWVALGPRDTYPRILRSPLHKPIDDADDVYAVTCFYIAAAARGAGVADALLDAAVQFARRRGAALLEAYPSDLQGRRVAAADAWRGTLAQFERAGFEVVARRKPARPIVRLRLG